MLRDTIYDLCVSTFLFTTIGNPVFFLPKYFILIFFSIHQTNVLPLGRG